MTKVRRMFKRLNNGDNKQRRKQQTGALWHMSKERKTCNQLERKFHTGAILLQKKERKT